MRDKYKGAMPNWLVPLVDSIDSQIQNSDAFEAVFANLQFLEDGLADLPTEIVIGEFRTRQLTELQAIDASTPPEKWLTLIIEAQIGKLLYVHIYKFKSCAAAIRHSLEQGNFTACVVMARSLLESACFLTYTFNRCEKKIAVLRRSIEPHVKRLRKNLPLEGKAKERIIRNLLDVATTLDRAELGSSFDWSALAAETGVTFRKNNYKKINVMEAIEKAQDVSGKSLRAYYDLLSELSHPNMGSHRLVVKQVMNPQLAIGDVKISDDGRHLDAASFFFDICSPSLASVLGLTLRTMEASLTFYEFAREHNTDADWVRIYQALKVGLVPDAKVH